MIERIIHFSIRNKVVIGMFTLAMVLWGTYSAAHLNIDAIPDITNNQVQIISLAPSLAVQEVESFITSPIEVAVANIPNIIELRSISRLGLSVVTVVFKDAVDVYWARQQITERLKEAEESIPQGVASIELAPVSTGLGEIYQYRLAVKRGYEAKYNLMELRTIQDWIIRRQMLGTPGVAEINSYGGFVKQYEIAVIPERLKAMNLTLTEIFSALENNNENTGSAYIDKNPTAYFIRGIGMVKSIEDIEETIVKSTNTGIPVLIRDVATVQYGNAIRYGALVVDTSEAVGGVVMMLKGANAHDVVRDVEARMQSIQKSLPEGVIIEPWLNRSHLVDRAIGTVTENLIIGALIVVFVLVLLLGNLRAGLIVASVIPLAMLFAVSMMNLFNVSGNLMSLGAIDFGLIVDGAVIIVESVVHRISIQRRESGDYSAFNQTQMDVHVFQSAKHMMSSATFGQIIILVVYLPILALTGIEGKMFRPMAQVVAFALLGAAILSLTYVPVASSLFLNKTAGKSRNISDRIQDILHKIFEPLLLFALRRKLLVIVSAAILFLISLFAYTRLGGEFIPQLEEGDLAAGVITLQGGSLSHTIEQVEKANEILLTNFPEVIHTVCKIGAGEIPTDPTPMETGDYIITLKPKSEWTSAGNREELVALMEEKLITLAGVKFEFQQPIQMRFNELMTGSKQDVAIKLFGSDLNMLSEKATEIERTILAIEGVEDINVEKVTGLAQIQVELNREKLAMYNITVEEANHILKAAFAGSEAGTVFEDEKRFSLVVRLDEDYRHDIGDVKSLGLALQDGGQITFEHIADIRIQSGPAQISRENANRRITVGFNVRNRDVQSVIEEVGHAIEQNVDIPAGYYISYGGQFQNLEAARNRLAIAVPVALLLIFVILYFTFHSLKQTLLIFTAVPLAAIGGIFALWIRGMNFSISAGVGFIALFGVAVLNGIVLIAEFNRLEQEGLSDITQRVLNGLRIRLRPVIMTAAVASLGFLPMAISTSAGAEVQKPLATVVIGGLITATLLTLVVLPVLYVFFTTRTFKFSFKNMKSPVLVLTAILLVNPFVRVYSQEKVKVDVNRAVELALQNNLAIKASENNIAAQKALRGTSWDISKTEIEGQYGQFNSNTRDNSFTISQSFSFPGVYINQRKLANANVESSIKQKEITELEISTQVKQTYWQLAFLKSKESLIRHQDSLYTGFLRAEELKARQGEINKLELIHVKSRSIEVKNLLQEVLSDIAVMEHRFEILLNAGIKLIPMDTVITRLSLIRPSDSAGYITAPQAGYMNQQVAIARLEKKAEINNLMPDFSVGYFSQTMQGTQEVDGIPVTFGPGERFTGFQAGISIPIWIFPHASKIKATKLKQKNAEINASYYLQNLKAEYYELLQEYSKYSKSLEYFEKHALPEADEIQRQSELSFRSGDLDYSDYIMSLNRALEINTDYLEALNGFNQTIIRIVFITGNSF